MQRGFRGPMVSVTLLDLSQEEHCDALHLALASAEKCDYLVTWNCEHLANANKFGHIQRVNAMLGLHNPLLVTPLQLMGAI